MRAMTGGMDSGWFFTNSGRHQRVGLRVLDSGSSHTERHDSGRRISRIGPMVSVPYSDAIDGRIDDI